MSCFPPRGSGDVVGEGRRFPGSRRQAGLVKSQRGRKAHFLGATERSWQDVECSSAARGGVDGAAAGSWPRALSSAPSLGTCGIRDIPRGAPPGGLLILLIYNSEHWKHPDFNFTTPDAFGSFNSHLRLLGFPERLCVL